MILHNPWKPGSCTQEHNSPRKAKAAVHAQEVSPDHASVNVDMSSKIKHNLRPIPASCPSMSAVARRIYTYILLMNMFICAVYIYIYIYYFIYTCIRIINVNIDIYIYNHIRWASLTFALQRCHHFTLGRRPRSGLAYLACTEANIKTKRVTQPNKGEAPNGPTP